MIAESKVIRNRSKILNLGVYTEIVNDALIFNFQDKKKRKGCVLSKHTINNRFRIRINCGA